MPEDTTATTEGGTATTTAEAPAYTPPQTQADLDRIVTERLNREKAKYADYGDLKRKAAEYDQTVQANQTEAQKAQARAEAAEQQAKAAATELARYKVAAAKGVPAELLAGSTEEELTAFADQLIAFRGQQTSTATSFDGGARTTAAVPQDMNDLIRGQLRR